MGETNLKTKSGLVVSDLHFLSARSGAEDLFEREIVPALNALDTLVLNGDVFDFRWAGRPIAESVTWAIDWVEKLVEQNLELEIHYVLGNHDCHAEFVEALQQVVGIKLHRHYLVLDRNLFLHGDAASYYMDQKRFDRFRKIWGDDKPRGQLAMRIYNFADLLKLSSIGHHLYFIGNTASRRIGLHLDAVYPDWHQEIDHCYFGHTHIAFDAFTTDQATFYNTGSAIKGGKFLPMKFDYRVYP